MKLKMVQKSKQTQKKKLCLFLELEDIPTELFKK